jgi:hypothetical protein
MSGRRLTFPAFIKLYQDAIWVAEEHCANVPMSIAERIGWPTGLGSMGEEPLHHFFDVGDRKRHVADADLIQHDRRTAHSITWVFGQHQEGHRLGIAIAQMDHTSLPVVVVIQMGQAPATGVLYLVLGDLQAQAITIKLQRAFKITNTESDM